MPEMYNVSLRACYGNSITAEKIVRIGYFETEPREINIIPARSNFLFLWLFCESSIFFNVTEPKINHSLSMFEKHKNIGISIIEQRGLK